MFYEKTKNSKTIAVKTVFTGWKKEKKDNLMTVAAIQLARIETSTRGSEAARLFL